MRNIRKRNLDRLKARLEYFTGRNKNIKLDGYFSIAIEAITRTLIEKTAASISNLRRAGIAIDYKADILTNVEIAKKWSVSDDFVRKVARANKLFKNRYLTKEKTYPARGVQALSK